jgi:hypothetical protein
MPRLGGAVRRFAKRYGRSVLTVVIPVVVILVQFFMLLDMASKPGCR